MKYLSFVFVLLHSLFVFNVSVSKGQNLITGFYAQRCPSAESIVHNTVVEAFSADPQVAARLLRLLFHDCFVQGCDGSILLEGGERNAKGNLGVGGFEVIQNAKNRLEGACPAIVSCADIVALAARDAVFLTGGPFYAVPTGRRDGRISDTSLAENLPDIDDSIDLLKFKFNEKGLSKKDLVLLSAGGHSIGTAACFFMPRRLYNYSGEGDPDPSIDPQFLPQLKAQCPLNGDVNVRLPLDWSSDTVFDDHIFHNIRNGFAVIASDAQLYEDEGTKQILDSYIFGHPSSFKFDFAKAMIKLGNIGIKTGLEGEIRKICNVVN